MLRLTIYFHYNYFYYDYNYHDIAFRQISVLFKCPQDKWHHLESVGNSNVALTLTLSLTLWSAAKIVDNKRRPQKQGEQKKEKSCKSKTDVKHVARSVTAEYTEQKIVPNGKKHKFKNLNENILVDVIRFRCKNMILHFKHIFMGTDLKYKIF